MTIDEHGRKGERGFLKKRVNKNAIRQEYRGHPDFLTTPSTPLKRIYQKTSRTPPPPPGFQIM
jgi:hypothetical protein